MTSIYMKSDISKDRSNRAKRNIQIAFCIKGVSILTSFLIVPITLGYLKPVEYGVWLTLSSILVWLSYFDIGLGNGLRNKLAEAIAQNNVKQGREYVSTTFFLLTVIIIPLITAILIINKYLNWHTFLNIDPGLLPNLGTIISIIFILCGVQFVVKVIGIIYIAHQLPVINDILNCAGQVISLLYIFFLTKTTNGDFAKVVIGFTLAPVLVYCLAYPYTFFVKYRSLAPSIKYINFKHIPLLGGLSSQFFIIQIVCLILFSSSNVIITKLFGPEAVTEYNIAFKYINVIMMVYSIIITPYWTAVTDAYHRKDYAWIKKSYFYLSKIWYFLVGIIVLQILVSKIALKIWINDEIEISFPLIICIGFFISILMRSNLYSTFFNGLGQLKIQLIIALFECVCFVLFLFMFAHFLGLISVPLSLGLSMGIGTYIYNYQFKKLIQTM